MTKSEKAINLSIGLPVYNGEDFVAEAIASLLAQTRGDFELVISDNHSTDRTWDIVSDYTKRDARIRAFRQPENIGPAANFAFVMHEARHSAFMWAAADDVWHPRWVETLLPIVLERPCLAYGQLITIDSKGAAWPHPADRRPFSFTGGRLARRMRFYLMPSLLGRANPIYGIFRREMFNPAVWKTFESVPHASDVLALYEILKDREIVCGGEVYLYKRRHDGSGVNPQPAESTVRKRRRRFKRTQLTDFMARSNRLERALLVALYPLAALGTIAAKLQYFWVVATAKPDKDQKAMDHTG
ncbi:MAG: glycosyltransferase family 2 protein [Rhodobacteraceae bacterium]|nr:glycosyltransferase family 2 protein [Paracoccaceae bacterium]